MAKQTKTEIYVSTDIEADGPIPGPHSMLSLASAAYSPDKTALGHFAVNLAPLPGASPHPKTMAWWEQHPEALAVCRQEPKPPEAAMADYLSWLQQLPGKPIFVGWPASWDFMWVYWYLIRFTGERPFSEAAVDIRSYAMGMRRVDFRHAGKNYLPRRWFDPQPHTHVALDDAIEQGALFCNMLIENRRDEK